MNEIQKILFFVAMLFVFFGVFVLFHENAHTIFNTNKGIESSFTITANGFMTAADANQFALLSAADKHDLFLAHSYNEAIAYNVFPIGIAIFAVLLLGVLKDK